MHRFVKFVEQRQDFERQNQFYHWGTLYNKQYNKKIIIIQIHRDKSKPLFYAFNHQQIETPFHL